MKRTLTIGIAVILLIGCIGQGPDLEFSAGPCDDTIDPYTADLGVKETTWVDDTTLVVTAYVAINCAEEIEGGSFQILGNKIVLQYTSPVCETCTFCLCAHKLVYTFDNLEKDDYTFVLERISS